jgi:hypothetical protein
MSVGGVFLNSMPHERREKEQDWAEGDKHRLSQSMGCTEPAWALRVFLSPAEVVSFLLQH